MNITSFIIKFLEFFYGIFNELAALGFTVTISGIQYTISYLYMVVAGLIFSVVISIFYKGGRAT